MKKAFTFIFCLIALTDILIGNNSTVNSATSGILPLEASFDRHIAYVLISASLLGIIKLKKNPKGPAS